MKRIFLIDNYDSFAYNLLFYLKELGCDVTVKRNDLFEIDDIKDFDAILISPGPGIPSESGKTLEVLKYYSESKNILGVCLGQQAIAEAFGGKLRNLEKVYHGVATKINVVEEDLIFKGIKGKIKVGRYHSWIVDKPIPENLVITSLDKNGEIMSLRHKKYNVRGVQFHPESVLTPKGKKMIKNWVKSI